MVVEGCVDGFIFFYFGADRAGALGVHNTDLERYLQVWRGKVAFNHSIRIYIEHE